MEKGKAQVYQVEVRIREVVKAAVIVGVKVEL